MANSVRTDFPLEAIRKIRRIGRTDVRTFVILFVLFVFMTYLFRYVLDTCTHLCLVTELIKSTHEHEETKKTNESNADKGKTKFPFSLLPPLQTEVRIIFCTSIKCALARLVSIVHLDGLTYNLSAYGIRNVVIYNLGDSPVDIILVNPIRVIFPLASAIDVTCVRKSDKVRMDVFLLTLLSDENKIDAMLSHDVYTALEPRDRFFIVDEIFHLIENEYTIVGKFLVVKITYNVTNIVDNVIFDKGLMNSSKGRERRDAYTSYVRKERTIVFYGRQNNLLHCKQSFSATGIPVMD